MAGKGPASRPGRHGAALNRSVMSIHVRLLACGVIFLALGAGVFALLHARHEAALAATRAAFLNGVEPLEALRAADERLGILRLDAPAETDGRARPLDADETRTFLDGLAEVHARLSRAGEALAPGPIATQVDELGFRLSALRAAGGEVTARLVRRELAGLVQGFETALRQAEAEALRLRGAAIDDLASLDRPLGLGGLALLAGAALLLVGLGLALTRPLRRAADTLFGLGGGAAARPKVSALTALEAAVSHAETAFGRLGEEHERSAAKARRRFEAQTRQARRRFDEMLDNMAQAFCVIGEDRALQSANHPFRLLFPHARQGMSEAQMRQDPDLARLLDDEGDGAQPLRLRDGRLFRVRHWRGEAGSLTVAFDDVTDRRAPAGDAERSAGLDPVTGLGNRTWLLEGLDAMLRRSEAGDLALLVLDVEGFRNLNTVLGYGAGDELLLRVGERLAGLVGPDDLLARLGNDEFAIVQRALPQPESALVLCRRIQDAFARAPLQVAGQPHAPRFAVGLVALAPDRDGPADALELLQDCDIALQRAKADPNRKVHVYEPGLRDALVDRRRLVADLREALERREFELFFQPIVDVRAGRIGGFEALARWSHPQRGAVSPGVFVPVMEEAGLIAPLGRLVLEEACRHAAGWPGDLQVSVNLSPLQFRDPALLDDLRGALRRTGLPPARLQIEVTESLFLDDADDVIRTLGRLRSLGLTIAMDDFGTGYSSLGYLSRFRFDKIKIDQSFVRDLSRPENLAIVRAVMAMASAMRLEVVAEGVETDEQRALLLAEGCTSMQGYFFSRPHSAADLPRTLLRLGAELARPGPGTLAPARRERAG